MEVRSKIRKLLTLPNTEASTSNQLFYFYWSYYSIWLCNIFLTSNQTQPLGFQKLQYITICCVTDMEYGKECHTKSSFLHFRKCLIRSLCFSSWSMNFVRDFHTMAWKVRDQHFFCDYLINNSCHFPKWILQDTLAPFHDECQLHNWCQ
jgi:hypothetical protein